MPNELTNPSRIVTKEVLKKYTDKAKEIFATKNEMQIADSSNVSLATDQSIIGNKTFTGTHTLIAPTVNEGTNPSYYSFTNSSLEIGYTSLTDDASVATIVFDSYSGNVFIRGNLTDYNGNSISVADICDRNVISGTGNYSLQQKGNSLNNAKGGTALGQSSIALGIGDRFVTNILSESNGVTLETSETANPNWQNMVARFEDEYKRIVSVDTSSNTITLESAFSILPSKIEIITQVAYGTSSFVCGEYSQAFGEASHAEGIASKAIGDGSFAGGYFSLANTSYCFAYGDHIIATSPSQAVFGKYNVINFNDIFIVGNGSASSRSDAFIVRADGRATVAADPTDALDVATKQYADTKVAKVNSKKVIYATSQTESDGIYPDTTIAYSAGLNSSCIVQRDADKQILVPATPTNNSHATSKSYVDNATARSALVATLGEASQQLNGLMSSTDKSRIDALYALLGETSDSDTVVNTINEVLAIFNTYPEGVSVVNSLANKLDLTSDQNITGTKTFNKYDSVNQIKQSVMIDGYQISYLAEDQVQSEDDFGVVKSAVAINEEGITIANFKGNNKESLNISNNHIDGKIELNYVDLEEGISNTIFLPKNPGTLALQHEVPNNQSTSVIVGNAVTNINGRVFQNYTATLITAGGYTFYQILKNGVNPTAEEAKEYMKYMTGSEFLPIYNYDYPRQTIFVFADRSIWKPQYSNNDGLRLYRISEPLALETNTPNVINAVDIVNNTLTQEQYNLITNGKMTLIKGTFNGYVNPVILSLTETSGFFIGCVYAGRNITNVQINKTSKYMTLDAKASNLVGVSTLNGKDMEFYQNNVYPYASNSTTQIEYATINNISVSANTTFTLATAPANTYPEYKGNITNSGANAITLTFTSVAHILCNDDNCVVSNGTNSTITLPAGVSIEISILNGKMLAVNFSAN